MFIALLGDNLFTRKRAGRPADVIVANEWFDSREVCRPHAHGLPDQIAEAFARAMAAQANA